MIQNFRSDKERIVIDNQLAVKMPSRLEIALVILILLTFIFINVVTAAWYPVVWTDEVMFTDPAANLYFGNGFKSSAWFGQSKETFWAGNVPLYPIILYHWMLIFGFDIVAVRSLNYVLLAISVLLIWIAVTRLRIINSMRFRLVLIALLLYGEAMTFIYRNGRSDCVTILIFTAALLANSIRTVWLRCVMLACISLFIPPAGLQLLAFTLVVCCLLLIYVGKSFFREVIAIASGATLGLLFLYVFYVVNQAWIPFLNQTFANQVSITGQIAQAIILKNPRGLINHFKDFGAFLVHVFLEDKSFALLFILLVLLAVCQNLRKQFKFRSVLAFGLVSSIVIPTGMFLLGRYEFYYFWMQFIPLVICLCSSLDSLFLSITAKSQKYWYRLPIIGILSCSIMVGLPSILASRLYSQETNNYKFVEALVSRNVTKSDTVYCDFGAYYAVKKRAALAIVPTYAGGRAFPEMTKLEKESISILIIDPDKLAEVKSKIGGQWKYTGDSLDGDVEKLGEDYLPTQYKLAIFRRKSSL